MLRSISIDDDLDFALTAAIEVTVTLEDNTRRWCFFITPDSLAKCGDWVPGTEVRFHYDAPHMIVVTQIDETIIESVINHLDHENKLLNCTRPVDPDAG